MISGSLLLTDNHSLKSLLKVCFFCLRRTVDLCQQVERTGVSFLTVHGRTKDQKSDPVNLEAIRLVKESVRVPVIANGDIFSLEDAKRVQEITGVNGTIIFSTADHSLMHNPVSKGVMSARGILENPGRKQRFLPESSNQS